MVLRDAVSDADLLLPYLQAKGKAEEFLLAAIRKWRIRLGKNPDQDGPDESQG